jgi:acetyltransferase EpsM
VKKLVILGGSGIGMIAASIADISNEYEVLGFLNDVIPAGETIGKFRKIPVLGDTSAIDLYLQQGCYFFIAYVGLKREKETFEKISAFSIPTEKYASLIHPTAVIPEGFCSIGSGVLIGPHAQLSPDTTLEDNCIMLGGSFLGHDSTMRRFAHLATNSVVGANVDVGRGVHVGSNATVREKIVIGDYSLIGAGAVVLNSVPASSVVVGNPGRLL